MAWSTPLTAVTNVALTAAQWNASVRDNLLETAVAKATAANRLFVSVGANQVEEREWLTAFVGTSDTTASNAYTTIASAGPTVTIHTGVNAISMHGAYSENATAGGRSWMSIDLSGATPSINASDTRSWTSCSSSANESYMGSFTYLWDGVLNVGTNVFSARYRTTVGTGRWAQRNLCVLGL